MNSEPHVPMSAPDRSPSIRPPYGLYASLGKQDFEHCIEQVTVALKTEGFGVLTDIDLRATLKNKLGVEVPEHRILGACNPALAHRAMAAEPDISLLLPCNVTVRRVPDGSVAVAFIDPLAMLQLTDNPEVIAVAVEALERLRRVRDEVASHRR